MSEIMRLVQEIEALSDLDLLADELATLGRRSTDERGLEIHKLRGANLSIFSERVGDEAAQRRYALQSYMLTLVPATIAEATALLKLVFYLEGENLLEEYEDELATRARHNVMDFLDEMLPEDERGQLACFFVSSRGSWGDDVRSVEIAADKLLKPAGTIRPNSARASLAPLQTM